MAKTSPAQTHIHVNQAASAAASAPASAAAVAADNKQWSVILIGDDGEPYLLDKNQWQTAGTLLPADSPMRATITQFVTFGTILADITNVGLGIGGVCTFVNVKRIVTGQ
jgi:hypothetical protein